MFKISLVAVVIVIICLTLARCYDNFYEVSKNPEAPTAPVGMLQAELQMNWSKLMGQRVVVTGDVSVRDSNESRIYLEGKMYRLLQMGGDTRRFLLTYCKVSRCRLTIAAIPVGHHEGWPTLSNPTILNR